MSERLEELRALAHQADGAYQAEYKRRMDLGEKELYKASDGELGRLRQLAKVAIAAYRIAKAQEAKLEENK